MFEIQVRSRSTTKEALETKKEKACCTFYFIQIEGCVRMFPSLKNAKSDYEFKKRLQLTTACYQKIKSGNELEVNSKKRSRMPGAGRTNIQIVIGTFDLTLLYCPSLLLTFEMFSPYTIIPPHTTIDFSRCFNPTSIRLLFCPIVLLGFSYKKFVHPILLFCPVLCLFRS